MCIPETFWSPWRKWRDLIIISRVDAQIKSKCFQQRLAFFKFPKINPWRNISIFRCYLYVCIIKLLSTLFKEICKLDLRAVHFLRSNLKNMFEKIRGGPQLFQDENLSTYKQAGTNCTKIIIWELLQPLYIHINRIERIPDRGYNQHVIHSAAITYKCILLILVWLNTRIN